MILCSDKSVGKVMPVLLVEIKPYGYVPKWCCGILKNLAGLEVDTSSLIMWFNLIEHYNRLHGLITIIAPPCIGRRLLSIFRRPLGGTTAGFTGR